MLLQSNEQDIIHVIRFETILLRAYCIAVQSLSLNKVHAKKTCDTKN